MCLLAYSVSRALFANKILKFLKQELFPSKLKNKNLFSKQLVDSFYLQEKVLWKFSIVLISIFITFQASQVLLQTHDASRCLSGVINSWNFSNRRR